MLSNQQNKNDLTTEEIQSIGTGFATRYFDALTGKPNASALRQFYNDKSKYVYAQPGRPDYVMDGLLLIGRFMKRMEYGKCTVKIQSVATLRRTQPMEFTISSVCVLSRPGYNVPRTFTQSSVVKRVPWTTATFHVVETMFKFDDEAVDFSIPIAVGDKPKGSRAMRTDTSKELVNPTGVSDKKTAGKPYVIGAPAGRVGKSNNSSKKSATTNGKARGQSSPRHDENKFARGTAMVLEKRITGKPIVTMMQPVANNSLKGESKKHNTQTTVGNKGPKCIKNVKLAMSVRSAHANRITFVSSNRYGSLAAADEDCLSDLQENPVHLPTASDQDVTNEAKGGPKKSRRNRKKNGCKRNNGGVAPPKDSNEVVGGHYTYVCRLREGWASIKEFVNLIFSELKFNPYK